MPQQTNGYDCGVFVLKYADYIARDAELDFTQSDMPHFRKIIMLDLLRKRVSV